MKLQCDQCGTNYTIADAKIQGRDRVFKIRCKTCGGIITFHGVADGAEGAAEAPTWYYVKDGNQVGPLTLSEMRAAYAAGDLTDQSYTWQAGMADWAPMSEVEPLGTIKVSEVSAEVVAAEPAEPSRGETAEELAEDEIAAPAEEAPAAAEPGASLEQADHGETSVDAPAPWNTTPQEADDAQQDADSSLEDLFGGAEEEEPQQPAAAAGGGDLFGGVEDESEDSGMVYQRRDNSVLFSLNDLEEPREPAAGAAKAGGVADSGLIDIRSFSKKKRAKAAGSGDLFADLAGDAGSAPAATDAAMASAPSAPAAPIIQRRKKMGGGALAMIELAVLIGAGGVTFGVMQAMKEDPAPQQSPQQVAQSPAEAPAAAQPPATEPKPTEAAEAQPNTAGAGTDPAAQPAAAEAEQPAEAPTEEVAKADEAEEVAGVEKAEKATAEGESGEAATAEGQEDQPEAEGAEKPEAAAKAKEAEEKPKERARPLTAEERAKLREQRERMRKAREERKAKEAAARAAAAEKARADKERKEAAAKREEKPPAGPDPNELLKVTGLPVDKAKPKEESGGAADPDLPLQPTNLDIKKAMRRANNKIRSCVTGAGESNVRVNVSFKVTPGGGVAGVNVNGTSASGCVASAVSGLRFPKSQNGRSVTYPVIVK